MRCLRGPTGSFWYRKQYKKVRTDAELRETEGDVDAVTEKKRCSTFLLETTMTVRPTSMVLLSLSCLHIRGENSIEFDPSTRKLSEQANFLDDDDDETRSVDDFFRGRFRFRRLQILLSGQLLTKAPSAPTKPPRPNSATPINDAAILFVSKRPSVIRTKPKTPENTKTSEEIEAARMLKCNRGHLYQQGTIRFVANGSDCGGWQWESLQKMNYKNHAVDKDVNGFEENVARNCLQGLNCLFRSRNSSSNSSFWYYCG
eukprot:gene13130-3920_t